MTVRKFLDISTIHLRPKTRLDIDSRIVPGTFYDHSVYGWFMWVPSADFDDRLEKLKDYPDLLACIYRARELDCDYILFDVDAEIDDALPTYED